VWGGGAGKWRNSIPAGMRCPESTSESDSKEGKTKIHFSKEASRNEMQASEQENTARFQGVQINI
jgi:hypothetical protein